jgi:hypothetical protein
MSQKKDAELLKLSGCSNKCKCQTFNIPLRDSQQPRIYALGWLTKHHAMKMYGEWKYASTHF